MGGNTTNTSNNPYLNAAKVNQSLFVISAAPVAMSKVSVHAVTTRRQAAMGYRHNKYIKATIAPPEAPPETLPDTITIPDGLPPLTDPFWEPYRETPREEPSRPREAPPAEEPSPGGPGGPDGP